MRTFRYLIVALLAVTTLHAQGTSQEPATFTISVRGQAVGQETVTLTRSASGWLIQSTGGVSGSTPLTIDKFEAAYTNDWQPKSLDIEAKAGGQLLTLKTVFTQTTATSDVLQSGQSSKVTHTVSPHTIILPNNFFGAYEAVAARLGSLTVGSTFPVYVAPQAEIQASVTSITPQRLQTANKVVDLRHYTLQMKNPGGAVAIEVAIDGDNRLARVAIPAIGIVVIRSDLSSVMTRDVTFAAERDAPTFIPALSFTLGATLTSPPNVAATDKLPAVVLVAGSGATDRDEYAYGIPIFGQLADALAKAGFFVVRYDKRGVGQSGGRTESAALSDYADDAISVVEWLAKNKNVDPKRIALVGHSEGGAVSMLAAQKSGKIAAIGLVAAPGQTGRDLVLWQQKHQLDLSADSADVRAAKTQLEIRILTAVTSGQGWDGIPPQMQRQADTPWFKSLIEFDPAPVMKKLDQPILIVQGSLDAQVPPHDADLLEAMSKARKEKAAPLTKKVILPGINHLLVPAKTGEVSEYPSLATHTISPDVAASIAEWLRTAMIKK